MCVCGERGSRAVLIGTEDRGQEDRGRREEEWPRGETGSPRALQWLTPLNDACLSHN